MCDRKDYDCVQSRYRVARGSESGHCCFEATVYDTQKECHGRPDWICECFDIARAHAIADAMNAADIAPLDRYMTELANPPVYQDRCGKGWNIGSALVYYQEGKNDFRLLIPQRIEFHTQDRRWVLDAITPYGHPYSVYGTAFEPHPWLLVLAADSDEVRNAL